MANLFRLESGRRFSTADEAADEAKKYMGLPGILGTGSRIVGDTEDKKGNRIFEYEVAVKVPYDPTPIYHD